MATEPLWGELRCLTYDQWQALKEWILDNQSLIKELDLDGVMRAAESTRKPSLTREGGEFECWTKCPVNALDQNAIQEGLKLAGVVTK